MRTHSSTGPTKSLAAAIGLTTVVIVGFHGASAADQAQNPGNFDQSAPAVIDTQLP